MQNQHHPEDLWGWDGELTPVPGFGFFPEKVNTELDAVTKEILQQEISVIPDLQICNLSSAFIGQYKCTILNETWPYLFPDLSFKSQPACPPTWDGSSCLPPTIPGSLAIFPCMESRENISYLTSGNATRVCLPSGDWDWSQPTNYSHCQQKLMDVGGKSEDLNISVLIYLIGYSVSLSALLGALLIFFSFRELRCLRHKIHIGLFSTVCLADISWISTAFVQSLIQSDDNLNAINIWCISQVILRYFHLTTFFWMFLEGLYLLLQVQLPLSLAVFNHLHCLLIGWGVPFGIMTLWIFLRIFYDDQAEENAAGTEAMKTVLSCPFVKESDTDFYAYKIPVFILLLANTVFLLWIMLIVVSKLHFQTAMDFDRRHYRAAKALVVVIPVLGFTYILTLLGPSASDTPIAYTIFQAVRAALLSTQGAVITLPYCYLNTEVQNILTIRWKRWRMIRIMESECQSRKSSLAAHSLNGEKRNRLRTCSFS